MLKTALHDSHQKHNAKTVEFAGYTMPIQYPDGILKEHLFVREHAGLFDVSHMGQALLKGPDAADFLSQITASDFSKLALNAAKYTVLLNDHGGIIDDLIITKFSEDQFFLVYNSGTKEKDVAWIKSKLPPQLKFRELNDRSLIALQGPESEKIIAQLFSKICEIEKISVEKSYLGLPDEDQDDKYTKVTFAEFFAAQKYMTMTHLQPGVKDNFFISRLGYTGEDGFEISVAHHNAEKLWQLMVELGAKPIGLGARDSLRLEMGYPLYGHDISDDTTPLEANLGWVIPKAIREKMQKPSKLRVGFILDDKSILREGVDVLDKDGQKIGNVTSGGFSPTLQKPIAQGYVEAQFATTGTQVFFELRGRKITGKVGPLNFIQPKTKSNK